VVWALLEQMLWMELACRKVEGEACDAAGVKL
jgi:hypothetical protein